MNRHAYQEHSNRIILLGLGLLLCLPAFGQFREVDQPSSFGNPELR